MKTMNDCGPAPWEGKSTLEEIRERFDNDVERFSNLETGQQAAMDAPLVLDTVAQIAVQRLRIDSHVLDLGCGAGNFTLRVLQEMRKAKGSDDPMLHCHLADLSGPMLARAESRLHGVRAASVRTYQSDLRRLHFAENSFCCILAGAVLHHLRDDNDWADVFAKLHRWLRPGGRLYVSDMVCCDAPEVQSVMWRRYGAYLESLGGAACREKVFAYIDKEDSPRSLAYQLELLRRSGFGSSEVLHRNSIFACYYGMK
jgi:tRNA (cmo5U34)-methyltransferase